MEAAYTGKRGERGRAHSSQPRVYRHLRKQEFHPLGGSVMAQGAVNLSYVNRRAVQLTKAASQDIQNCEARVLLQGQLTAVTMEAWPGQTPYGVHMGTSC